ncbi:MAG: protein kinase [Planctomycetaceae bacterium]|nr:protein kinase [Planctomycetaceae bacterium]
MGQVLLATDTRLERKIAIKRVLGKAARNKKAWQRSVNGAKTIAKLNHPNIVKVYEYGIANDGRFMILDCVNGGSLLDRCIRGAIPLEEAIDITCQWCDGIGKAIVHVAPYTSPTSRLHISPSRRPLWRMAINTGRKDAARRWSLLPSSVAVRSAACSSGVMSLVRGLILRPRILGERTAVHQFLGYAQLRHDLTAAMMRRSWLAVNWLAAKYSIN